MPHEGYADPITNNGPRFHSNMHVSELAERDTRAIKASVVTSAPSVVETVDGVTHKTRPTPTKPNGVGGSSRLTPTQESDRPRLRLEVALRQIEPGEKMQMSPSRLCLTCSEADRVISTFSFDPNLKPCPQNLHRGEASGPAKSVFGTAQLYAERQVKEQWNAT